MDQTLNAFFILTDNAKSFAHLGRDLAQKNLRGLPGRAQLERMRTRFRHDQIDVLLQRNNFAPFLEAGSVWRTGAREQRLTRGNRKDRWYGPELLQRGVL